MDQDGPPKQDNPIAKYGQTVDISRYRVVVEVALHDRAEPLARSWDRVMHAPTELLLNFQQFGPHSLVDRFTL
jgi:hypothetical protein